MHSHHMKVFSTKKKHEDENPEAFYRPVTLRNFSTAIIEHLRSEQ